MVIFKFFVVEYREILLLSDEVEVVEVFGFLAFLSHDVHTLRCASWLNHDIALVVDHTLELLRAHTEQVADLIRERLEVPDVYDRHSELDVAHALTAYFLFCHLYTATVANDTLITDTFVLAAVALVVLGRAEYALAEEAFHFGLVGTVIDCFGFLDLAM